jgi:KaiC/GvpD/RAD55 family RecA-like ATPase
MEHTVLTGLTDVPEGPELAKAPTGIRGLDQITGGGLPLGRVTLVTGNAGAGKTLLGIQFLVAGARDYGEPGVLVTFEESAEKVAANVRSLGFDLDALQRDGLLAVLAFRVDPAETVATGEFDFEPLFIAVGDAIMRLAAKRVVLDTIEVLFGAFGDDSIVRGELSRLAWWLEERGVTAIVTGERDDKGLSRHGIEEYVSDCVIVLDHRVREEVSTRRLRVVKYRGSAHGTNEYPFMISARGFVVLPVTSISLDYDAPDERILTGITRLDHMLGGGLFRGSTVRDGGHRQDLTRRAPEVAGYRPFEPGPGVRALRPRDPAGRRVRRPGRGAGRLRPAGTGSRRTRRRGAAGRRAEPPPARAAPQHRRARGPSHRATGPARGRASGNRADRASGGPSVDRGRGGPAGDGLAALGRCDPERRGAAMSLPHAADDGTGGAADAHETWDLRLYVTGRSPKCLRAVDNLRRACEEYLAGRYRIEVVDLLENPRLAADDQILAVPTVVRKVPKPMRRLVGDLSDTERLLVGLQLRPPRSTAT